MTGTKQIDQNDANVGESRTADQIIDDAGFTVDEKGETHRRGQRDGAPAVQDAHGQGPGLPRRGQGRAETLGAYPEVTKLQSPLGAGSQGLVSKDRHSVMIQYAPKGKHEEAILYIDKLVAAVDKVDARHAGLDDRVGRRVRPTRRSTTRSQGGLGKAGHDLDPADDHRPDARARARSSRRSSR